MNAQGQQVQAKTILHLLSPTQYKELEKKALAGVIVTDQTTPVQAGHFTGIEKVLRLVREGFTA